MSLSTVEFDYIRTLVHDQAAIVLDPGKEYLVESRLTPLASREGYLGIGDLVANLRRGMPSTLKKKVVDAMTTNETSFFRDHEPFEVLKKTILPELIKARAATRQLNIWCAASSTGQEPYSVAMMIRENFPELATWKIFYLATDIAGDVLERARAGRYTQLEVNRGLPVSYLVKYFDKKGTEWQLNDKIRDMVQIQKLNLIRPWPLLPPLDIVMIRNVLIYFDPETKKKILQQIHSLLRPDGSLFLGGAETTLNLDARFKRMPYERAGCYRLDQD